MNPMDSPLGLPPGALRSWAVVVLGGCAALCAFLATAPGRRAGERPRIAGLPVALAVTLTALLVRALFSVVDDGGLYDIFQAYRVVGDQLRSGGDVFVEPALGLSNYPPVIYWWWALASAIPAEHPHLYAALVRLPFWVADAAMAPLLLTLLARRGQVRPGRRAAWVYALSPVAIAVPTLHGQFDPLVNLALLPAVVLLPARPVAAGLLLGAATAIKPWPLFFLVPLLALLPRRRWPGFIVAVAVPPAAAFAAYGLLHPDHLGAGLVRVATYVAHRQGLGSSFLLGPSAPSGVVVAINLAAGAAACGTGVVAARRGRAPAEVVAAAMLVLLALSPTVSDQYLMWPLAFLLLAGRHRPGGQQHHRRQQRQVHQRVELAV
ncbi:MAG: glycosyltransferase 87 family protein, partial [Actinobacteria bacterium]|nr:glycosyltransferase 87 family protein [Actinomycetota bacterium]